jgi:hypothetical protein
MINTAARRYSIPGRRNIIRTPLQTRRTSCARYRKRINHAARSQPPTNRVHIMFTRRYVYNGRLPRVVFVSARNLVKHARPGPVQRCRSPVHTYKSEGGEHYLSLSLPHPRALCAHPNCTRRRRLLLLLLLLLLQQTTTTIIIIIKDIILYVLVYIYIYNVYNIVIIIIVGPTRVQWKRRCTGRARAITSRPAGRAFVCSKRWGNRDE